MSSIGSGAARRRIAFVVSSFGLVCALGCGSAPQETFEGPDASAVDDGSVGSNDVGSGGSFDVGSGGTVCKPRTCADVGANCGPVADGCGALTASCGTCADGKVCGGGGVPSVCGTNVNDGGGCKPRTCAEAGATCGPIGDGCGGAVDCGTCAAGTTCGGGGTPSVCGVKFTSTDGGVPGACTPKKCSDYPGVNCGFIANGCGDVVDCGTCGANEMCGLAAPNVCGAIPGGGGCVKKGCADYPGVNCGPVSDGCGGFVECGTCSSGICGGAGVPSQCGDSFADGGASCVKKTCADYPGANCGFVADGCGDVVPCGTCPASLLCGGANVPNQCGNPFANDAGLGCTPKTCADQGFTCGQAGDGCGGVIASCGACASPAICGGGGIPSQCGGGSGDGGVVPGCTDPLCSQIEICSSGETTITGTVYAPNATEPLYNANVYIPKGKVEAFGETITCDRCDAPKPALVSAITGPDGKFTLKGAIPSGSGIPLVIELGRWRRYVTINVTKCVTNTLTSAQTRLPKRQAEGHALDNIPRMAMVTGSVDALECVLRKMGIDAVAFGNPTTTDASKRIQIYRENGAYYDASTPSYTSLVDSATTMRRFDAILFACRGGNWTTDSNRMQRVREYANEGGRVFATHWSHRWLRDDSEWKDAATWGSPSTAGTDDDVNTPLRSDVATGFTKGADFAKWLDIVSALATVSPPRVDIFYSRRTATDVKSPSTKWISSPSSPWAATTQHMTFNTPFTATDPKNYCGRVIFSDFHVNNASSGSATFPNHCSGGSLTDQEKILEFMLFDLASCVNGDNLPPPKPPTCTERTCNDAGAKCGQVANGCGGLTADCGTCPPGQTCGGGGVANQCGGPSCTKTTCTALGLSCGKASDGCSGTLDCGTCPKPGETCGGGGVPGQCGGPSCTKVTCASTATSCGYIADGCGNKDYCGDCTVPGSTCGGGGLPGQCGAPMCPKKTCADYGASCGWVGDGCGGKSYCGDCTVPGSTCGGGGVPGVCGAPTTEPCKPRTCIELGTKCGPAGDGCGGLLDCGKCVAPDTCGGGGVPGECGGPKCTPKTCAELGFDCGPAADGCGGTLDCGTCVSPMSCGGGGAHNKCGGGPR